MAVPKLWPCSWELACENLRYIPCDDSYRMMPSQLERAIREDRSQRRTPIAVVASEGTVNTGSIDPLREIAAIARSHDLWLHVDGAYGAFAAIAAPEKFDGLALADSLSLTRTNGCTNLSTADACSIATLAPRNVLSLTPVTMPGSLLPIPSRASRFSRSPSSFRAASAP